MSTPPPEENGPRLLFATPHIHVASKPPALKRNIRIARPRDCKMRHTKLESQEGEIAKLARCILGVSDAGHHPHHARDAKDAQTFDDPPAVLESAETPMAAGLESSSPAPKGLLFTDRVNPTHLLKFPTPSATSSKKAPASPLFLAPFKRLRVGDRTSAM